MVYFVYRSSLGSGRGFISLVSLSRWSADSVGSFADDDEDKDILEVGRFWKYIHETE